jgi:hypothetical protein
MMRVDFGRFERPYPGEMAAEDRQRLDDETAAHEADYDEELRRCLLARGAHPGMVAELDRDGLMAALDDPAFAPGPPPAVGDEMGAAFEALVAEWGVR